jgi:nicotinamide-nucleotide amidase
MNTQRIGFLATGTEIVQGDIVNTNAPVIAAQLNDVGFAIGLHMMVSDEQIEIEHCLQHLLSTHDIVIITGGLGPTTDDRTRFAVANVVQQELVFNQNSWDKIVARLTHFNIPVTENNRQQALFPAGAHVISNPNGTADGCIVKMANKAIYLLPGPPMECIPLFEQVVLPDIKQRLPLKTTFKKKWRLFGIGESQIAEQLETILQSHPLVTGYRIDYPYLEFKIEVPEYSPVDEITQKVVSLIQPYFLSHEYHPASQLLKEKLAEIPYKILIVDQATAGQLQATLVNRQNRAHIAFAETMPADVKPYKAQIILQGIADYWQANDDVKQVDLQMVLASDSIKQENSFTIPYRGHRTVKYVVEFAASKILNFLDQL